MSAIEKNDGREDDLLDAATMLFSNDARPADCRRVVAATLYKIGMIGLKRASYESFLWTTDGRVRFSSAEISDQTRVSIHPCFWRTLGIQDIRKGRD
jgi:hypothetical protein